MKITYHGHSCFTLEHDGYVVAIDPYDPGVPGYGALSISANKVYCSHGHGDHAYVQAVEIVPADKVSPFTVTEIEIPHDHHGGSKRGFNTIRVFEAGGKRVIHFGDIGCHPAEESMNDLRGADAALVPVGGFFTIGPQEAWDLMCEIKPGTIIPMHFRTADSGYPVIAVLDDFLSISDGAENVKVLKYGESYEI